MWRSTPIDVPVFAAAVILALLPVNVQGKDAANWCEEAERHLTDSLGQPVTCSAVNKRCVRMNNYWCQKHGRTPWRGTPTADGVDGHRDENGHAIFASVRWSARAIAMDLRSKYRRGRVSAVAIASAYSPWCDTWGSKAVVRGHGRTCRDGGAMPPSDFLGPYCQEPARGNATSADCSDGCNCPPAIAAALVRGLPVGIHDDLQLFDRAGRPLSNLAVVIRNLAIQEQSIFVRAEAIENGIAALSE